MCLQFSLFDMLICRMYFSWLFHYSANSFLFYFYFIIAFLINLQTSTCPFCLHYFHSSFSCLNSIPKARSEVSNSGSVSCFTFLPILPCLHTELNNRSLLLFLWKVLGRYTHYPCWIVQRVKCYFSWTHCTILPFPVSQCNPGKRFFFLSTVVVGSK